MMANVGNGRSFVIGPSVPKFGNLKNSSRWPAKFLAFPCVL
jgi:hypothetical protein